MNKTQRILFIIISGIYTAILIWSLASSLVITFNNTYVYLISTMNVIIWFFTVYLMILVVKHKVENKALNIIITLMAISYIVILLRGLGDTYLILPFNVILDDVMYSTYPNAGYFAYHAIFIFILNILLLYACISVLRDKKIQMIYFKKKEVEK